MRRLSYLVFALGLANFLQASVTLNLFVGDLRDADNTPVPDGTLWALVVDDATSGFAGFGPDDSLFSAEALTAGTADSYFTTGQTLNLGLAIGGGTIFAMGGVNGATNLSIPGAYNDVISADIGVNGVVAGRNFAIFWFPNATYDSGNPDQTIDSEVGGLHALADAPNFLDAMVIPADGTGNSPGALSADLGGNRLANSDFRAVSLAPIPEPTSALLAAFGSLALLRRRRVVEVAAE